MMDERQLCGNNSSVERGGSRVGGYNCHQLLLEEEGVTPYPPTEATSEATLSAYSFRGIHRNKHTIRFLFRSFSFLVLIGGYSVRNYYYYGASNGDDGGGGVDSQSLRRRVLLSAVSFTDNNVEAAFDATNQQEGEF